MIIVLALLFRFFLNEPLKRDAIKQADEGLAGGMQGHAAMAMGEQQGPWIPRLFSKDGWVTISHAYMNWVCSGGNFNKTSYSIAQKK